MVQPTTSTTCYSSILDRIGGAAFALGALALRIASCAASIFAALGDFIASRFRADPTPFPIAAPIPVAAVTPDPIAEGKRFLLAQVRQFTAAYPDSDFNTRFDTQVHAREALADIMMDNLVLDLTEVQAPLPFFIARETGNTASTFESQILELRRSFAEFPEDVRLEVRDRELFDQESASPAYVFWTEYDNLLRRFLESNPTFLECADAAASEIAHE